MNENALPPSNNHALENSQKISDLKRSLTITTTLLLITLILFLAFFFFQQQKISNLEEKIGTKTEELLNQKKQTGSAPEYLRNQALIQDIIKARSTGIKQESIADGTGSLLNTTDWAEKVIHKEVSKMGENAGTKNVSLSFRYPTNSLWILTENIDQKGCGKYILSRPFTVNLTIEVTCPSGWSALHYPVPGDSVVVRKAHNETDDGSVSYLIRFLADGNGLFKYSEVLVYPPEKEVDTTEQMQDLIFKNRFLLNVTVKGNSYDADLETGLKVADTVMNSISFTQN